jgi:hypothetical protein
MTAPESPSPDSLAAVVAELRQHVTHEWAQLIGDRIERLDAEMRNRIQKYRERLEVTGHYVMDKGADELVRVDNPPDVDEKFDGIYCRDTTIKCLEELCTELRAKLAACESVTDEKVDAALLVIFPHERDKHLRANWRPIMTQALCKVVLASRAAGEKA